MIDELHPHGRRGFGPGVGGRRADVPPEASVTFRSVDELEVARGV